MNKALLVVQKFGGQTALASLLGRTPSTIHSWIKAETIPSKWHGILLGLAEEQGVPLISEDFIEIQEADEEDLFNGIEELSPKDEADQDYSIPVAKWPGILPIGATELPVYVLSDGRRVISRRGATNILTSNKGGGNLEQYIYIEALKKYLPEDISDRMIRFQLPNVVNKTVLGLSAETFLDICTAYVQALNDNALMTSRQRSIAIKASMFSASCAKTGLIALIDEATGYQYVRAEDALAVKLRAFLEEEMRKWESTFPPELWQEFGRLTHWKGTVNQRPKYWGKLVMELIYEYLDSDVAEWLRENNPKPHKGQNHHQWLSSQLGLRKLIEHIWMVIGLARGCHSMSELKTKMAEIYGRQPVQYTLFLPNPSEKTSMSQSLQRTAKNNPAYEQLSSQLQMQLEMEIE